MENSKHLNKWIIKDYNKFKNKLKELGSFEDIASNLGYSDETIRNWYYYRASINSDAISRILKEYNIENGELGVELVDEKEYNIEIFKIRLKELIDEKKIKKINLAVAINVDKSNITNWLNKDNKRLPPSDKLQELANYFDVTISYLLGNTDNKSADNEIIGKRLGMSDESIAVREEIKNTTVYGKKFEKEIKNVFGFNHTDVSNYISSNIGLVDVFYGEALKVLSYYNGGNFKNSFDSLFNEMEVDLTENELLGNDNDKDYIPMEISTPYRVTIETMTKAILQKKIGIMFDEFIDEVVKKKQISKYNDYNYQEKKIKEQISKLEKELSDIEQIKKNN